MDQDSRPQRNPDFRNSGARWTPERNDVVRLEEIGDLHYEASAYTSALDYYQRILDTVPLHGFDLSRALAILRKSIDAALNVGDLALTEQLLNRAFDLAETSVAIGAEDRRQLTAPLLGRQATLFTLRGAYRDALQVAKRAFAILAITDDHGEVANLQVTMGVCHHRLGRADKAEEFYADALATFRRVEDELGMAALYNNLAVLQKNACQWARALDFQRRSIDLAATHGATHLLARLYLNEGIILRKAEHPGEARASLEKCLRLARSLGDNDRCAKASLALGQLELYEGHLLRAEELILEGKNLADQFGYLRESVIADEYLGDLLAQRGDWDRALYNYGIGLEKTRQIGKATDLEGELLRRCAEAQLGQGDYESAAESANAALAVCANCGEIYETGFCEIVLGESSQRSGRGEEAAEHYRAAVRIFREQQLAEQASRAVLAHLESRLDAADREERLLLRRQLMEVLEGEQPCADDALHCRLQLGLAEVQGALGEFDESLLTICDLERALPLLDDDDLAGRTGTLRARIEESLVGDFGVLDAGRLAIRPADLEPARICQALAGLLDAALARTGVDRGFALVEASGSPAVVVARRLTDAAARRLGTWFMAGVSEESPAPRLMSRPGAGGIPARVLGDLANGIGACLFVPIALPGKAFGVVGLLAPDGGRDIGAFKPALDFITTTATFLAMSLTELERDLPAPATPAMSLPDAALGGIITDHPQMHELLGLIRKVAASDLLVLIQGETGTGKGLLARAIHDLSARAGRKILSINCAAIPESLLESELFGHVKGSFTGAYGDKKGLLAEAEGGTVFLDEIGKLPLGMQGKLLHFLDTRIIRPVGGNLTHVVDVRVICATKSDLKAKVARGEFLEDLYYRLLDFPVSVPPLRDRREDISLLVPHFVEQYAQSSGRPAPQCTASFMSALMNHDWPGNVRELVKTVNRAIVLAQGDPMLRPEHLPEDIVPAGDGAVGDAGVLPLRESLAVVEAREIANALTFTGGNKAAAARMLKISYPNLLKKIRLYELDSD